MDNRIDIFIGKFCDEVAEARRNVPRTEISRAINMLIAAQERDGRVYIFGNGGSWSMAGHFASDFNKTVIGRIQEGHESPRIGFNVIRLPTTTEELTAIGNDVGYNYIFLTPLKRSLRESDLVIAISSSGNSPNIIMAVEFAKSIKVPVIGISGFDGGRLNELADAKIFISTPRGKYGVVESTHSYILHLMTEYFKEYFDALTKRGLGR